MADRKTWAKRVAAWRSSSLTPQFAAKAGVSPRTLRHWAWRVEREAKGALLRVVRTPTSLVEPALPAGDPTPPAEETIVGRDLGGGWARSRALRGRPGGARADIPRALWGRHRHGWIKEDGVIPVGIDIYFGAEPVGLRWGFDRLCGVVTERIGRRPRSGAIFVFFGKRRHAMKVFYFDGIELCIF